LPRRRNFAGFVRQAFASLAHFDGQYPVLGSWLVDHTPCGLSIHEDESPITGDNSRFLPHAILQKTLGSTTATLMAARNP